MDEYKRTEKQLHEALRKQHLIAVEIGEMAITPRSDSAHYSITKLDNLQRQFNKLDDEIWELREQLAALEPTHMMQINQKK
jgi:hypothetical protein